MATVMTVTSFTADSCSMPRVTRTSMRSSLAEESNDQKENAAQSPVHAFRSAVKKFQYGTTSTTSSPTIDDQVGETNTKRRRSVDNEADVITPTKKRKSTGYAAPSKYAHLSELVDILEPGLICVFVGTNPGVRTAQAGHAYAHPSNLFWKLLHSSGCTDIRLRPDQDRDLPRLYTMGNTNIVARPSKNAAELSKAEMAAGTPILEEKFAAFRPEAVCIVGKGIWEAIWRWRYKREIKNTEFKYGWQDDKERMGRTDDWPGSRVYVAPSTSGLSAALRPAEKEALWKPFGDWVKERRKERSMNGG